MQIEYPRSLRENLLYRNSVYEKCSKCDETAAYVREYCARDIIYWINVFCWTKDPRKNPSDIPFICYETFQEQFIHDVEAAIENQEDVLIEKSRDMGVSWMVLYVFQHKWMFKNGNDFRVGSRKEDYVDLPGDIDTLFEKLRYNFIRQPKFLKPDGFDLAKHSTYMKLINPENGNSIVGESANENFGTGGRRTAVLFDEYAKWDLNIGKKAWTSTADVTKCRIPVSTPFGIGNKHQELAESNDIKKIILHWTLHPEKCKGAYLVNEDGTKTPILTCKEAFDTWTKYRNIKPPAWMDLRGGVVRSEWYDAECLRRKDEEIAQELDIDYLHSGVPYFEPKGLRVQIEQQREPIAVGELRETVDGVEWLDKANGAIMIYELPDENETYLVTADASEAIGQDEASALVGNVRLNSTAAIVADQYPSHLLARYCVLLSKYYRNAKIIPETKSYGTALCKYIDDMGGNIHRDKDDETKMGFVTSATSRPEMLAYMDDAVRLSSCWLYARKVIDQCMTFVKNPKKGMKPEASPGKQDGLVICFAIFQYMRRIYTWKPASTIAIKRNMAYDRAIEERRMKIARYRRR